MTTVTTPAERAEREAAHVYDQQGPRTAGWTTTGPVEIGPGQIVVTWTHPGVPGVRVDDNTGNDGGMTDLTPAQLAEHAWVGHRPPGGGWDEFGSFYEAALWALEGAL